MLYLGLFAAALIACTAAFAARSEWERRQLKTEHYSVQARPGGSGEEGARSLRLAFLSDVHGYFRFEGAMERLLEAIDREAPELVLLGGDLITLRKAVKSESEEDIADALAFTGRLAEKYPVIYAYGNHERRFAELMPSAFSLFRSALLAQGVQMPDNEALVMGDVAVYGADPEMLFYRKLIPFAGQKTEMPEKYLIGKLGLPDRKKLNILLIHTPLYLKEAAAWGADLVLSGHFHGGTVRLPDGRGLMSPQFQFFCRECSGVHREGDTVMIVTRGLGTHTFDIRLNDLPELSIIDITF